MKYSLVQRVGLLGRKPMWRQGSALSQPEIKRYKHEFSEPNVSDSFQVSFENLLIH